MTRRSHPQLVRCLRIERNESRPTRFLLKIDETIHVLTEYENGSDTTPEETLTSGAIYNHLLGAVEPRLASHVYEDHVCLRPFLETMLRADDLWIEIPAKKILVVPSEHAYILVKNGLRIPKQCVVHPSGSRLLIHQATSGIILDDPELPRSSKGGAVNTLTFPRRDRPGIVEARAPV